MNIINDRTSDYRMCAGEGLYQEMHGRGCGLGGNGGNSGGGGLGYGSGCGGEQDLGRCEADDYSNYGGTLTGEGNFIR
jgi:hypothetical protein